MDSFPNIELDFNIYIKRPHSLLDHVSDHDIRKLKETIARHKTHNSSTFRDLIIVKTAIRIRMKRSELAILLVRQINFGANSVAVMGRKGSRDRVIPN